MQIGISYGSLVTPVTLTSLAKVRDLVSQMSDQGMFFQGLPFRQFHRLNINCRYIEEPWPGLVSGRESTAFGPTATKIDRLVFTAPSKCRRWLAIQRKSRAIQIDHQFNQQDRPVELHKGLGTIDEIIAQVMESDTRVVLDTCHLREVKGYFGNSRAIIRQLVPRTAVVHVQPTRNTFEWHEFLSGKPTELAGMLYEIRSAGFDGDFVIETSPFFHNVGSASMLLQFSFRSFLSAGILQFSDQLRRCLNA